MLHTFIVKGEGLIEVLGRIDATIVARSSQSADMPATNTSPELETRAA